jgi:hypothetical protein
MKRKPFPSFRRSWNKEEYDKVKEVSKKYEDLFFSIGEKGDVNRVSVEQDDKEVYIRLTVRPGKGRQLEGKIPDTIDGYPIYYEESTIKAR